MHLQLTDLGSRRPTAPDGPFPWPTRPPGSAVTGAEKPRETTDGEMPGALLHGRVMWQSTPRRSRAGRPDWRIHHGKAQGEGPGHRGRLRRGNSNPCTRDVAAPFKTASSTFPQSKPRSPLNQQRLSRPPFEPPVPLADRTTLRTHGLASRHNGVC
mgnify:CR=1 FL=1